MNGYARTYIKSSWSGGEGGNCVEWAFVSDGVFVRDSKDPAGPELFFAHHAWLVLADRAAHAAPHPAVAADDHEVRLTGPGGTLHFTHREWTAFAAGARAGECRPTNSACAAAASAR